MNILGLNAYHGDASAAILVDGELVAFAAEERFNRIKHCAGFPEQAIRYCLETAGLTLGQIDFMTTSKNPHANFLAKVAHVLSNPRILSPSFIKSRFRQNYRIQDIRQTVVQTIDPSLGLSGPQLVPVEHHLAHAASAFYVSPFERAAILTLDGMGDAVSAMLAIGEKGRIRVLKRVRFPHSLGILYTAVSQHLGFQHYGDEGKVMGLAAYGDPQHLADLRRLIHPLPNGLFALNIEYFSHAYGGVAEVWEKQPSYGILFSPRVKELLGQARIPKSELTKDQENLARSLQEITEEIFFHLLRGLHKETGEERLCFAGGVALNCVMNGKIESHTPFRQVYIQPDAGDGGTSLGGALHQHFAVQGPAARRFTMEHPYYGSDYTSVQIEKALRDHDLAVQRDPQVTARAARAISEGQVVGWFQGRMEVGPRALGNRSILADPRKAEMKAILNDRIKHREAFRPFAPSVLEERCADWFEGPARSPFMLLNYKVRPERRAQVPAITHVDGTARVQTVSRQTNPRYWELISEFEKRTGVPLVLNTSFNDDEPIVRRPEEAIDCFLRTRMDLLVLGDYWVERKNGAAA